MWHWKLRNPEEWTLVREAEAFLQGTYPRLRSQGWAIPDWAWVNSVAHGSAEALAQLASGAGIEHDAYGVERLWQEAEAFLAHEVLGRCSSRELGDLQRSALVPLELDLARGEDRRLEPAAVVQMVLEALDQVRGVPKEP